MGGGTSKNKGPHLSNQASDPSGQSGRKDAVKSPVKKDSTIKQDWRLYIEHSSIPACSHFGPFIEDKVKSAHPGVFYFKTERDMSQMPRLEIKIAHQSEEPVVIHSTTYGDPLVNEKNVQELLDKINEFMGGKKGGGVAAFS